MAAAGNVRLERCRPAAVELQVTEDECEEYKVDLPSATGLELSVRPDISGGETRASLDSLKLLVRPES